MRREKIKMLSYLKFTEDSDDPYRCEYPNNSYCTECDIVYIDKNWKLKADNEFKKNPIVCPACKKIKEEYYEGILYLKGNFVLGRKDEILNLIRNEEKKQRARTALSKIGKIVENAEEIVVYTTNDRLAYRIGKALFKAYKGELTIRWSDDNIFTRVYWERND
ncbi:hypothetical protein FHQ18_04175 [Deferribacter autotrophicus]|uniref:ATPase n=1 Tax=Deferribacter autotrophicus TaxID=500465 RepID=A0A5A8F4P1_9BACT|nr:BCAM0308 family protein [Deferribacter autotrophicus]KAA0258364.1 hypothetical protein FHQ18_04175 [Deferribacter autotrophicus]